MSVLSLNEHKERKQENWLEEVDRLLTEHFSLVHTDLGWSPKDVEREYLSGITPMGVVMRLGDKTDVIYTN